MRRNGAREAVFVPASVRAGYDEPHAPGSKELEAIAGLPQEVSVWPHELYPIPDAQEFNPSGSVSITGGPTTTAIPIAPQVGPDANAILLPNGNTGIIRSVLISITNMLTTTVATFTVFVDGAPVAGYSALSMTPRVAPYVSASFDCMIRLPNKAKVTASATVTDGGTYVCGIALGGWYQPQSSIVQWYRRGIVY